MWILTNWRSRITSQHWATERRLGDVSAAVINLVRMSRSLHLNTGDNRPATVEGDRRLHERKAEVFAVWPQDHADEGGGPEENAQWFEKGVHVVQLPNPLVEGVLWIVWRSSQGHGGPLTIHRI